MKHILLLGAGKSATVLIRYLRQLADEKQWRITIADGNIAALRAKVTEHPLVSAVELMMENDTARKALIAQADVVISMMPPALHERVALDCLALHKHLLTASYVSDGIKALAKDIEEKGLLFLCEMGLDPGIDHMSAMQLIEHIRAKGGIIHSFRSHCGGLVAPESDDNPWHYKISWNPRNVVTAGKAGALFKENGAITTIGYRQLFHTNHLVQAGDASYAWYPNRDSLAYIPLYHLEEVQTFIRTTLRHPAFCEGWQQLIDLQLTDESYLYQTNGLSYAAFFQLHFTTHHLTDRVNELLLQPLLREQLCFLGLDDTGSFINKGMCSCADILQQVLESKLILQPHDKDMIIMLHELDYTINRGLFTVQSLLEIKGDDYLQTAMAKTVGLPLGIAARLILEEKIMVRGLHLPVIPAIYTPVLQELSNYGIVFKETTAVRHAL